MQRLVRLAEMLGVPPEDLDRLERRGLDSVRDEVARGGSRAKAASSSSTTCGTSSSPSPSRSWRAAESQS